MTDTASNSNTAAWQQALRELAQQSNRRTAPRLVVKRPGVSPWWAPALWWVKHPSAWCAWGRVIVSEELVGQSPDHYLLAHELGHVAHHHHFRYMLASLGAAAAVMMPHTPGAAAQMISIVLFIACVISMIRLQSLRSEYQADRFAATLLGKARVVDGIKQHAKRRDGQLDAIAAKRLAALEKLTASRNVGFPRTL